MAVTCSGRVRGVLGMEGDVGNTQAKGDTPEWVGSRSETGSGEGGMSDGSGPREGRTEGDSKVDPL